MQHLQCFRVFINIFGLYSGIIVFKGILIKNNIIGIERIENNFYHHIPVTGNRQDLRVLLTPYCNLKCGHCHNEGGQDNNIFPLNDLIKLVEFATDKLGVQSVRLTGGDPSVHPEFHRLLQIPGEIQSTRPKVKFGMNTNGQLFIDNAQLLKEVADSHIAPIVFGMDQVTGKAKFASRNGVDAQVLIDKVIFPLRDQGLDIAVDAVLLGADEKNQQKIKQVIEWGCEQKISVRILERNLFRYRLNGYFEASPSSLRIAFINLINYSLTEILTTHKNWTYIIDSSKRISILDEEGKIRVSFLEDACADGSCACCRQYHIRTAWTKNGIVIVECLLRKTQIPVYDDENAFVPEKMLQYLDPLQYTPNVNLKLSK